MLAMLVVFTICTSAFAATHQVKQDGTGGFETIQDAIDAVVDGDLIVVHPGTYYENVRFDGENITLRSRDPEDLEIDASTIIDGGQKGSVVTFADTEDETCLLAGFTITRGHSDSFGGGVLAGDPSSYPVVCAVAGIANCTITGSSADHGCGLCYCAGTISNCTISGNWAEDDGAGGGLYYCRGTICNCTISGNSAGESGGALHWCWAAISNCIVWGNQAELEGNELWYCGAAFITYSCIQGWTDGGEGNISDDPLFVSGPLGDYYLSCRAAGQAADSPCIDRGSGPAESLGLDEFTTRTDHVPDSGIVDIGCHYPLTLEQNPQIDCSLNASEFSPGDLFLGFIEAQNSGPDAAVDAYVAFVLPDGAMISLTPGGLAVGTYLWVSNVVLPTGFDFGPSEVFRMTVPDVPGSYIFAAALTEPGQFGFIGEPSISAFAVVGD